MDITISRNILMGFNTEIELVRYLDALYNCMSYTCARREEWTERSRMKIKGANMDIMLEIVD